MVRLFAVTAALAALAAPAALAKEGARAHLLAPLPTHARPGTLVTVRWTVTVAGAHGKRIPFGATGMFVTLVGSKGVSTRATAQAGPPYQARVRVPAGGIHHIRFGLMGTGCDPSGCRPRPIFFPLR
jgi:hypothetical protein